MTYEQDVVRLLAKVPEQDILDWNGSCILCEAEYGHQDCPWAGAVWLEEKRIKNDG